MKRKVSNFPEFQGRRTNKHELESELRTQRPGPGCKISLAFSAGNAAQQGMDSLSKAIYVDLDEGKLGCPQSDGSKEQTSLDYILSRVCPSHFLAENFQAFVHTYISRPFEIFFIQYCWKGSQIAVIQSCFVRSISKCLSY